MSAETVRTYVVQAYDFPLMEWIAGPVFEDLQAARLWIRENRNGLPGWRIVERRVTTVEEVMP